MPVGNARIGFSVSLLLCLDAAVLMASCGDAELKAWDDARYKGCHNYSKEGMPEVSTVSVQSRVNYSSSGL